MRQGRQQSVAPGGKRSPKRQSVGLLRPRVPRPLALPHSVCLPQQWTGWALALRGKFDRSWLQRTGLQLTLLQARGPLCLHLYHSHAGHWTVTAEIQLAIRPLLERTFWRGAARNGASMPHGQVTGPVVEGEVERRGAAKVLRVPPIMASQAQAARGGWQAVREIVGEVAAPIARVFRRNARVQDHCDDAGRVLKVRVLERDALALRVVRSHARIEKLAQRTLVSARPAGASAARQVEHPAAVLEAAPVSPVGVKGRLGMDRSDFDLERLTERVVRKLDDRLIAHRERLGKLF